MVFGINTIWPVTIICVITQVLHEQTNHREKWIIDTKGDMWQDIGGRTRLRVNEVDLIVGVTLALQGKLGVTKKRISKVMSWMVPVQLDTVLDSAVRRGLLRTSNGRYTVRMEKYHPPTMQKERTSEQIPAHGNMLKDVRDIYGLPWRVLIKDIESNRSEAVNKIYSTLKGQVTKSTVFSVRNASVIFTGCVGFSSRKRVCVATK